MSSREVRRAGEVRRPWPRRSRHPRRPRSSTLYFGPWYRRSPFFEKTLEAGCSAYDIYNHMYLPGYYADPVEEYWALLDGVTCGMFRSSASSRSPVPTRAPSSTPSPAATSPCARSVREIRPDHGRGRRHRQRPCAAPGRGGTLVARSRGQRCRAVGAWRRGPQRYGRHGPRARGLPGPGPGAEVEGHAGHVVRPRRPRHQVLLDAHDRGRRHPGRDLADRLDGRGRLRDLPARPVARSGSCGTASWRPASRTASDPSPRARRAASRRASSTTART